MWELLQICVSECDSVSKWISARLFKLVCVCVCAREREHESVGTDQSMSQCESVSLSELVCVCVRISVSLFESVWVNQCEWISEPICVYLKYFVVFEIQICIIIDWEKKK